MSGEKSVGRMAAVVVVIGTGEPGESGELCETLTLREEINMTWLTREMVNKNK